MNTNNYNQNGALGDTSNDSSNPTIDQEDVQPETLNQRDGTNDNESMGNNEEEDHRFEVKIVNVLTKVEDGGTNNVQQQQASPDGRQATRDAFQLYSNTNVRMMHLLGLLDGNSTNADPQAQAAAAAAAIANNNNQDDNMLIWRMITGYQGRRTLREGVMAENGNDGVSDVERRTRLSTELHMNAFRFLPREDDGQE